MRIEATLVCIGISVMSWCAFPIGAARAEVSRVSRPGLYQGYGEPLYAEDFHRTSEYVAMRDGTKLAVDIYRPRDKVTGAVVEAPLPVVWMHTPYNRRYNGSRDQLTVEHYPGTASRLIKYGYVVATVDFRGLYASFGHNEAFNRGEWTSAARHDAYDITEWLARQPWSTGKIGMWGCSATGGSQMQAVTVAPPHLRAIFPMSFEFDVYDFRVPGGIPRASGWTPPPGDAPSHEKRDAMAAPVDADVDGSLLALARAEHAGTVEDPGVMPFRDSVSTTLSDEASKTWWIRSSPSTYLQEINASGVAMYMAVNWDEGNTKVGPFFAINNVTVPAKLLVGPGVHCDWQTALASTGFDLVVEERRFFDYWLKGIDNGIMEEDPVTYYTYNAPPGKEWSTAKKWPLAEEQRVAYFLKAGALTMEKPRTSGGKTSATLAVSGGKTVPTTAFVFETAPLSSDLQLTGHATMALWVSSTATDGDFIVTVQDVAPDGTAASYHTQGQLRASLRRTSPPPYNRLGLPYHRAHRADVDPLVPGQPTKLEIALLPISMIFKAGHRIRLRIESIAPAGQLDVPPIVTVHTDEAHPSQLILPLIN